MRLTAGLIKTPTQCLPISNYSPPLICEELTPSHVSTEGSWTTENYWSSKTLKTPTITDIALKNQQQKRQGLWHRIGSAQPTHGSRKGLHNKIITCPALHRIHLVLTYHTKHDPHLTEYEPDKVVILSTFLHKWGKQSSPNVIAVIFKPLDISSKSSL